MSAFFAFSQETPKSSISDAEAVEILKNIEAKFPASFKIERTDTASAAAGLSLLGYMRGDKLFHFTAMAHERTVYLTFLTDFNRLMNDFPSKLIPIDPLYAKNFRGYLSYLEREIKIKANTSSYIAYFEKNGYLGGEYVSNMAKIAQDYQRGLEYMERALKSNAPSHVLEKTAITVKETEMLENVKKARDCFRMMARTDLESSGGKYVFYNDGFKKSMVSINKVIEDSENRLKFPKKFVKRGVKAVPAANAAAAKLSKTNRALKTAGRSVLYLSIAAGALVIIENALTDMPLTLEDTDLASLYRDRSLIFKWDNALIEKGGLSEYKEFYKFFLEQYASNLETRAYADGLFKQEEITNNNLSRAENNIKRKELIRKIKTELENIN